MNQHRLIAPSSLSFVSATRPFSSFQYLEDNHQDLPSIHRCFSLARSMGLKSLVVEDIPAAGILEEENNELAVCGMGHRMKALKRLTFWDVPVSNASEIQNTVSNNLIGYAILKHDACVSPIKDSWHIFEAVFRKYPHEHNCVPRPKDYSIRVDSRVFTVSGVLYCQQNGLNKACAHVALRSLLSRRLPEGDCSYALMNSVAAATGSKRFKPSNGLGVRQIRAILDHLKIPFRDIDYDEMEKHYKTFRKTHPFQKYVYAGIESGCGALLGFSLSGPKAPADKHIIPFYGHTFNKDTWVPDAELAYFNVGGGIGYIPSESWTSSYLGHDDNFGPNFCVPRLYANPQLVEYVVQLLPDAYEFDAITAEAIALRFLYSLYPKLQKSQRNPWMRRLAAIAQPDVQRVVLRAVAVSKTQYLNSLKRMQDWEENEENPALTEALGKYLPDSIWLIEISSPQLFPANERKLGEILMNPSIPDDPQKPIDFDRFLLCRLPGRYFFIEGMSGKIPIIADVPSELVSHTPVFKFELAGA